MKKIGQYILAAALAAAAVLPVSGASVISAERFRPATQELEPSGRHSLGQDVQYFYTSGNSTYLVGQNYP